jgi:hypothetical protein
MKSVEDEKGPEIQRSVRLFWQYFLREIWKLVEGE